nr:polyphosphate kinase 2 [Sinorhizobium meliloti]
MAALTRPCRALAIQAIAVEIPIPNRAAADRADIPLADAARTRWRRSSLNARAIFPPTNQRQEEGITERSEKESSRRFRFHRKCSRTVALPAPSDREKTQWYFQRYVPHLPAGGEIVLFDRSWYNRCGVERVMGFATEEEVEQFFDDVPEFERMLVRSGVRLVKYWFSITDEEQQLRFLTRIHDPLKQWKLSPMDLQSRVRWEAYTKAKEETFARTNIREAPWHIVEANDKKRARLNCIDHLLKQIPYEDVPHEDITLPERIFNPNYERKVLPPELYVPAKY